MVHCLYLSFPGCQGIPGMNFVYIQFDYFKVYLNATSVPSFDQLTVKCRSKAHIDHSI